MKGLWLGVVLLLLSAPALGHKASDSYLSLTLDGAHISGQWDIALRDLDYALSLDRNDDGALTWGEVRAHHADIAAYTRRHLTLTMAGAPCPMEIGEQLIDQHSDGAYSVLRFRADCAQIAGTLNVDYRLLFDLDPQHKGLLRLSQGQQTQSAVFTPRNPTRNFLLGATGVWRSLLDYAGSGVWHIWRGVDHILFLIALLLPAVLQRTQGEWRGVTHWRPALIDTLKIVSAFTVAHSITLSAATLGLVHLPSRPVESIIAASVILAALNNVFPLLPGRRWMVAGVFGLIHGFGFASVLTDLGLPPGALASALVGFNLGVELGQLALVSLFLPLAYVLRASFFYRYTLRVAGSVSVAGLASMWLVERAFNLRLLA
jgi:hypothetical protein